MYTKISKNTTYSLEIRVTDGKGNSVTDLDDVECCIIRVLDNNSIFSGKMEHIGFGVYKINISLSEVGQYRVLYNLEDYYTDFIETIIVVENTIEEQIHKINERLDNLYRLLNPTPVLVTPVLTSSLKVEPTSHNSTLNIKNANFSSLYDKMIARGWILVRIEGPIYYFKRNI